MQLIVISYPEKLTDEANLINHLFEKGLEHFHLRKPAWNMEQVERLIRQLDSKHYHRVVLHNHFGLAKKYQLGGIHLSKKTKAIRNNSLIFQGSKSISCRSLEELKNLSSEIDYAFLGPVFPSISQKAYSGKLQLSAISRFLKSYRQCPVIASGGINEERLITCLLSGFSGIAVFERIWEGKLSPQEIGERFSKIRNSCQRVDHL